MGPSHQSVECLVTVRGRSFVVRHTLLSPLVVAGGHCPFSTRKSLPVPGTGEQGELGEPVGLGGANLDAEMALGFSNGHLSIGRALRPAWAVGRVLSVFLADNRGGGAGHGIENAFLASHGSLIR